MASSGAPNSKGEGGTRWRTTVARAQIDASCPSWDDEPGNRALANVIAEGKFGKRRALYSSPAGLGLLRVSELRQPAHMLLPALMRPAAALGGAGAEKVALRVGEAEAAKHGRPAPDRPGES
jgi:hypothetical protein